MLNLNPFTAQQTLHINPTKEERKPTNSPFVTIIVFILFIWLWIIIKVLSNDSKVALLSDKIFDPELEYRMHPKWSWKFPVGILSSVLIAIIYIYIFSKYGGKCIIYVGMFLLGCMVFIVPTVIITQLVSVDADWIPKSLRIIFQVIFLPSVTAYLIMAVYSTYNVEKETISGIIKDACRVLRCCPSISVFSFLISLIIIITFMFSVYMALLILYDQKFMGILLKFSETKQNDSGFNFELFTHTYCSMTLIHFLTNFAQIVIAGYVMDWFWSKDLDAGSLTIRRSLGRVLNFHMGSVAFYSILPLPQIWSLYQFCRRRDSDGDIVKRYNTFTRFCAQFRVFGNVIDYGMIQTSIYGYESRTAITAAHDLVAQNNHEFYLAVSGISDMFITFGLIITATPFLLEKIFFSLYAVTFPFYILLATVIRTLIVNKMIINYTSDSLKEEEEEEKNSSRNFVTVL